MRKYYDEFNEEYERGYRAGQREALRNLEENLDDTEQLIATLGEIAEDSFDQKVNVSKNEFDVTMNSFYLNVSLKGNECLVHFGSTREISDFERIQNFVQKVMNFYKKCEIKCKKAGYDIVAKCN